MEGTIRILQERNLNNPTNKSAAPVYPVTKAKAVLNSDGKTMEEVTSDLDERLTAAEEAIDIGEVGKTLTLTADNWEKYAVGSGRTPAHIDLSRLEITKLVIESDVYYPIMITLPNTIKTIDSSAYAHGISYYRNTAETVANLKKVISYNGSELALYALKTVPELPEDTYLLDLPEGSITISNPENSYYFNTTQELYNVLYYCVTSLSNYTGRLTTRSSSATYPESSLFWGSDMHKKLQQIWNKAYYNLSTTPSFKVTFYYSTDYLYSVYQSGTRHLNNTLECEGSLVDNGVGGYTKQVINLGRIHLTIDKGSYPNAPISQSFGGSGLRENLLNFSISRPYPVPIIDGGTYSVSGYYGEPNSDYTVTINSRTYVTHTSAYVPSVGDYVFADATCDSEQDYGKSIIGKVVNVDTTNNVAQVASVNSLSFNVPTVYKYFRMWGPRKDMDTSHYPDVTYTYTPDNVVIEGESQELVYVTPILDSTSTATYSTINDSTEYTAVYNAMGTGYKEAFDEVLEDLDISKSTDKLMPAKFNTLLIMAIIKLLSKQPNSGIVYPSTYEEFISGVNSAISSEDPSRALLYYPFVTTGFLFDGVHYKVGNSLVEEIELKPEETLNDQFAPSNWYLPNEAIMVMIKTAGMLNTSYVYGYAEEKDNLVLGDSFGGYLYISYSNLWDTTTKSKAASTNTGLYFYFVTTIEI